MGYVASGVGFISFWSSYLKTFNLIRTIHRRSSVDSMRRSAAPEHKSTHLKRGVKIEMKPIQSHTVLFKTGRHLNLQKEPKYLHWC